MKSFFLDIVYSMKMELRRKKNIASMTFFPIVFLIIVGFALSGEFKNEPTVKNIEVFYIDNTSSSYKEKKDMLIDNIKTDKIKLKQINSLDEGKKEVERDKNKAILYLEDDNIKIIRNSKNSSTVEFFISYVNSILYRSNIYTQLYTLNKGKPINIDNDFSKDYTTFTQVTSGKKMTSFDYYGVVYISMMMLYGGAFIVYLMQTDANSRILSRYLISGTSFFKYYMRRFVYGCIITIVSMIPYVLISKYIFNVNWGNDKLTIFLIVMSMNFLSMALMSFIAVFVKNPNISALIIDAFLIPILTFLGGGYVYMGDNMSKTLKIITSISPIKWVNRAMINVIHWNDYSLVAPTIIINLVAGTVFILMILFGVRRSEA